MTKLLSSLKWLKLKDGQRRKNEDFLWDVSGHIRGQAGKTGDLNDSPI
ncbi:hypothetical protein [Aeromonas hydrophila]|nr:hypothetical protein [Aeromonas hydrophila]